MGKIASSRSEGGESLAADCKRLRTSWSVTAGEGGEGSAADCKFSRDRLKISAAEINRILLQK